MIKKVRDYMSTHDVSAFNKSLIEADISRLELGTLTEDVFKINCSIVLGINVDTL